jgi:hypothetical protein
MFANCRLWFAALALAVAAFDSMAAQAQGTTQILITPECKVEFYGPPDFERPRPDYVAWDPAHARSLSFKDPRTQVTLYVESDGRHLAAIASSGTLLWVRNPFEDAGACPYRSPHPVIYSIAVVDHFPEYNTRAAAYVKKLGMLPTHSFVRISFDSSQFGIVDEESGNFFMEGQN